MPDDATATSSPAEHPALARARKRAAASPSAAPPSISFEALRALAVEAGAEDVGTVDIDDPLVASEVPFVRAAFAKARTLVVVVLRMHTDNLRSPKRSVANAEFSRAGHDVDEVLGTLARALSARGHPTIAPAMAFPMEMDAFPGRTWVVSHKVAAHAAGLGVMGLHRNLIHPRLGSHILLGTLITSAAITRGLPVVDENPCIDCKLCVAACPVGAIEPGGAFRFSACYDHNYREFMTGFSDFVEAIADSPNKESLRQKQSLSDQARTWQSLAFKPVYNAAYCLAVCPAGDDVIGPFVKDRAAFVADVVKPLQAQTEQVYAVKGSDAEAWVKKRFPHKRLRLVSSSLRPVSVAGFFSGSALTFQRGPARGWRGTFHFDFDPVPGGELRQQATFVVDDGELTVSDGLVGKADVCVAGDGDTWVGVVAKEKNPVWAVVRGALRISGKRALLDRFAACFPR